MNVNTYDKLLKGSTCIFFENVVAFFRLGGRGVVILKKTKQTSSCFIEKLKKGNTTNNHVFVCYILKKNVGLLHAMKIEIKVEWV